MTRLGRGGREPRPSLREEAGLAGELLGPRGARWRFLSWEDLGQVGVGGVRLGGEASRKAGKETGVRFWGVKRSGSREDVGAEPGRTGPPPSAACVPRQRPEHPGPAHRVADHHPHHRRLHHACGGLPLPQAEPEARPLGHGERPAVRWGAGGPGGGSASPVARPVTLAAGTRCLWGQTPMQPGAPVPRPRRHRRGPFPALPGQVRYSQLVRKKQKAQHRCLRRVGRTGSRRSGYAFSHQEGFGELIMSGKNMRLSSLALAGFATRSSSSWIESLRRKKSDSASSPGGGADKPLRG